MLPTVHRDPNATTVRVHLLVHQLGKILQMARSNTFRGGSIKQVTRGAREEALREWKSNELLKKAAT